MNEFSQQNQRFLRDVDERLKRLREICVIETVDEGRARLAAERPMTHEPFDKAVERRLRELRALMELTTSVHAARTPAAKP
ncbi:MAG: hypothetical protein SF187_12205 [Deltaproteobacteria bacterium]|nr:hypothetical protein [Deltaproteobacteria bacterium]